MNCEQYQENISQFIDCELGTNDETNLFRHLSACNECRAFLKETLSLRSELLGNQTVIVPESLNRKILVNTEMTQRRVKPTAQRFAWIGQGRMLSFRAVGLAIAIAILTSAGITSLWYRSNVESKETVVYIPTLPAVEVYGYISSSSK